MTASFFVYANDYVLQITRFNIRHQAISSNINQLVNLLKTRVTSIVGIWHLGFIKL